MLGESSFGLLLILLQQLLAIWNKAKGKEKDALLWGDEVRVSSGKERQLLNLPGRVSGGKLQKG